MIYVSCQSVPVHNTWFFFIALLQAVLLRSARGLSSLSRNNINYSCSADHEHGWQPYLVDPYAAKSDDSNAQSLTNICSSVLLLLFLKFSVLVANPKKLLYTWSANQYVGSIRNNLLRGTDPVLCKLSCVSGWEPACLPHTSKLISTVFTFLVDAGDLASQYTPPTLLIPSFFVLSGNKKQLSFASIPYCPRYVTSTEVTLV